MRKPGSKSMSHRYAAGIIFTIPLIVVWCLLLVLPIGQTIYHSLTQWNGIKSAWIGFSSYQRLLNDSTFWRVIANNGILLASVPFAVLIPLVIAFLLNEKVTGWRVFRTIFFLPATVSWVVIGMVSLQFFIGEGILNHTFAALGLGSVRQNMLASANLAIIPVALTFVWSQVGPNTLILLTGMATISPEIYGAAKMEGAGWWTLIWQITVPLLRRFLLFSLTITLIAAFTALFSLIYVMTSGGPNYGTTTLEFFIYQRAFNQGQFGFGATLGVVLLIFMLIVSVFQFRFARFAED
ncbi:MAG TPA: sugar ABC transporter permease [Spirochaetia bacterium]|nr:sugar ABC transporter permease [Spirochaetia bacterium]